MCATNEACDVSDMLNKLSLKSHKRAVIFNENVITRVFRIDNRLAVLHLFSSFCVLATRDRASHCH